VCAIPGDNSTKSLISLDANDKHGYLGISKVTFVIAERWLDGQCDPDH
jgi:hypothetical protein